MIFTFNSSSPYFDTIHYLLNRSNFW